MSAGLNIVYLSCCEKWWDWERGGFVSRPARIAKGLAEHPDVKSLLVVDTPSSAARRAVSGPGVPGTKTGITQVDDKVSVFDQVRTLPRERVNPVSYEMNGVLHERALVRAISQGVNRSSASADRVMWMSGPLVARTATAFADDLAVYDAMDEWLALPEMHAMRSRIARSYATLSRDADVVFAVTNELAGRFASSAADVHVVANGVDAERFRAPRPVPLDIAELPRPVVGYVGMLQDRVDVELIRDIAHRMPRVAFAFVGPVLDTRHFSALSDIANVHLLGPRSADDVPAYLRAFDACFLPHRDTELTRCMDPLKLYEYIAAGKVSVATDLPFDQPSQFVRRAKTADEFAGHLHDALFGTWRMDEVARAQHLRGCSWETRVQTMIDIVDSKRLAKRRATLQ